MPVKTLSTPSIIAIGVFDPQKTYDIRFTYADNQSVKNRVVIMDANTYETVYDKTQITMKLLHTIPENTLETGKSYTVSVQVFDIDNNQSNFSDSVLIYCYSMPTFVLENIPALCKNASITLPLSYIQSEGEKLKSYQFFMYDINRNIQNSSKTFYAEDRMSYTFSGLQNHNTYYFRAIGETVHGFQLDTGYHEVTIEYNVVPTNAILVLNNEYTRGYISIKTNIKSIGYELKNENYYFEGDTVTLYGDNYLKYNEGFSLDGDFSLFIEAKKLPLGTFLCTEMGIFTLSIIRVCEVYYCEFKTEDYVLYSPLPKACITTISGDAVVTKNENMIELLNYDDNHFVVFEVKRNKGTFGLNTYYK